MNRLISQLTLVVCLSASCLCPQFVSGFEQGSYFVFELADSETAKSETGRLIIKKTTFVEKEAPASSKSSLLEDGDDFVIDFSKPVEKSSDTSFGIKAPDFGADEPSTTQESSSFGTSAFGTSDSVFGD